jgi:hypothetical protein
MIALVERQMWHPLGRGAGSLFGEQSRVIFRECRSLTRANVMKQAASLDLTLGMLRPGINSRRIQPTISRSSSCISSNSTRLRNTCFAMPADYPALAWHPASAGALAATGSRRSGINYTLPGKAESHPGALCAKSEEKENCEWPRSTNAGGERPIKGQLPL